MPFLLYFSYMVKFLCYIVRTCFLIYTTFSSFNSCCSLNHSECYYYMPPLHSGRDYVVNLQNLSSRTFTVTFQPKQLNATEHVIQISDDNIFEDKEHFLLRIHALRFIGEASKRFTAQPGITSSFAEVAIKDDDSEFSIPSFTICALVISHNVSCSNIG